MTQLRKIPAFGLESKKWGACAVHERRATELAKQKPNNVTVEEITEKDRQASNTFKIAEMIPLVGIFFGILGLLSFISKKEREDSSIHFVERHLIAASGFGWAFLPIADTIATIVRNRKASKKEEPQPKA